MKRLFAGLLLSVLSGIVGCGSTSPVAGPVAELVKLGAGIERNEQGEVVTVGLSFNTQITDAGLVHLKGLTNLQALWLAATKVTEAGVAELQEALPNCTIVR